MSSSKSGRSRISSAILPGIEGGLAREACDCGDSRVQLAQIEVARVLVEEEIEPEITAVAGPREPLA
jgi:hypothetical protein